MKLVSEDHSYVVGKLVAEASRYRLYLCTQEDTGRELLLQIPTDATLNGLLDRSAFILRELKRQSDELEAEYAMIKEDPKNMLNYHLAFPEIVDSFVCEEQGGRRVNIYAFRNVEDVRNMIPLSNIIEIDRQRVDLKTSGWVMGKLLKLLTFAHSLGYTVGRISPANILIEPNQHYVLIFDWFDARTHPGEEIPTDETRDEIRYAAQAVINLLGGDLESRSFPNDNEEGFAEYTKHLLYLASGAMHSAKKAHQRFYDLIRPLWGRSFHPFTSFDL